MENIRSATDLAWDLLKRISTSTNEGSPPSKPKPKKEKCPICGGHGWIADDYLQFPHPCKCRIERNRKSNQEAFSSTMSQSRYQDYMFKNFDHKEKWADAMFKQVAAYCEQKGVYNLLLLGQPGSGKTHLAVAAFRYRMQRGAKGAFLDYVAFMREIKQHSLDHEAYNELMQKYKKADIVLIDDFLKNTKPENVSDLGIVFELLDHRYKANLPTIITSEFLLREIANFDEAIAGRLKEMADHHGHNYVIQIGRDNDRDYRFKGEVVL